MAETAIDGPISPPRAPALAPASPDPAQTAVLDACAVPAFLADPASGGALVYASPALLTLTGFRADELIGRSVAVLRAEKPSPRQEGGEGNAGDEVLLRRRNGSAFWANLTEAPLGGLMLGQIVDVSRRRDAEGALALSRQREALGLLTNSVAHEFNNFLQILIGYIDGLRRRLGDKPDPFVQRAVVRSTDAAERAAILTRQLLTFSRRIAPDLRPIDLDTLLADTAERLRPTLPPGIRLELAGTPDLPPALSNPAQIELAVSYVVANACEAMQGGGTLSLSTSRLAAGDRAMQRTAEGSVAIVVSDTGAGMSPEMLARALAPFATSREAGRGAGLAIVHGLMKRQNGTIVLDSRPGEGTSVRLIFPAA